MEKITGSLFREMILNASAILEEKKQTINELNVFPVPDGDTGTNMSLTMGSAAAGVREGKIKGDLGESASGAANALLRGARGNSGVILSLLFRGLSQTLKNKEEASAAEFALAMSEGVKAAYKAVMKPTEGTILTVSRLAAAAACDICAERGSGVPFEDMLDAAHSAAEIALADTINQNPVLKKAGVIDSGGKGYVYILEAMLAALRGEKLEFTGSAASKDKADFAEFASEEFTFGYEAVFTITRNKKDIELFKAFLGSIGDSIVVVEDDELVKVHVHTDQPGVVLTEALNYGDLQTYQGENLREQHSELAKAASEPAIAAIEKSVGVVAVCAGDGLTEVFTNLGADRIVSGGQTMNPSTEDILKEIHKVPAEVVYVLPNNSNIIFAANQCVELAKERRVIVIPTNTVPQGVSALLALDSESGADETTVAMNAAITNVRTLSITKAARDSTFDGAEIAEGDSMVMLEGKLLSHGSGFDSLKESIIESIREANPEFITLYYGIDADSKELSELETLIGAEFPDAEVTVVSGGQPVYEFIIAVE